MKNPPMTVLWEGISLTPKKGNQTQKIPPTTSVRDNKVNSAAGICLDPSEYKINPMQTKVPWVANNASFLPDDKKLISRIYINIPAKSAQNKPARATVVNLGVSFLHLKLTEKTEKPKADTNPKIRPSTEPKEKLSKAINVIPVDATIIAIQTLKEILSFKNKNPNNAVINGIAAKQSKVIAAVVLTIDQIKVVIAVPRPIPPITPEIPIFK